MIDRVLIVDTETTGLEPDSSQVIEIGAILYSVRHQTTLQQMSVLLPAEDNPQENVNRIKPASLQDLPVAVSEMGFSTLTAMASLSDLVVAHNAEFDRKWFGVKDIYGTKIPELLGASGWPLKWVCTCTDFEWPRQTKAGQSLVNLALAHDIGVSLAHRALADCQLIAALFDRMEDLQAMFTRAMRPKGRFVALVSYDDRHLAKEAGFKWLPEAKTWERTMAISDAELLPFPIKQVSQEPSFVPVPKPSVVPQSIYGDIPFQADSGS
jgi:DNA polymerase-3 subunit epsilon